MSTPRFTIAVPALLVSLSLACSEDDGKDGPAPLTEAEVSPVAEHYAALVYATYSDSLAAAEDLQEVLLAFTADPTEATLADARGAWLRARTPYGLSEAFRFYGGPIDDDETGPEGQINGWPLDELYIDYVVDDPDAGIVNDTSVTIDAETLAGLNEQGGEKNIATGYHAIEFLLWGQDLSEDSAGTRSADDFVDGGAAPNPDRRRLYLDVVTQLLVDDLTGVTEAWAPDTSNYRAEFVALPPKDVVQDILRGIGALAGAELANERINTAYETKLQEEEHSCFSDNTHNDILNNFLSVKNVYFGTYEGLASGPGVDTIIEARDAALAEELEAQFQTTEAAVRAIPAPFDNAILGDDSSPGRQAVSAAIDELRTLGDLIVEAAALLDITLSLALE